MVVSGQTGTDVTCTLKVWKKARFRVVGRTFTVPPVRYDGERNAVSPIVRHRVSYSRLSGQVMTSRIHGVDSSTQHSDGLVSGGSCFAWIGDEQSTKAAGRRMESRLSQMCMLKT